MIKRAKCRELNIFDHYEALTKIQEKAVDLFINKHNLNKAIAIQFELNNNNKAIIHKSTKKADTIQLSYFDKNGAYSDKEFNSLHDAVHFIYINNRLNKILY